MCDSIVSLFWMEIHSFCWTSWVLYREGEIWPQTESVKCAIMAVAIKSDVCRNRRDSSKCFKNDKFIMFFCYKNVVISNNRTRLTSHNGSHYGNRNFLKFSLFQCQKIHTFSSRTPPKAQPDDGTVVKVQFPLRTGPKREWPPDQAKTR